MVRISMICGALIIAAPAYAQDTRAGLAPSQPDADDNSDIFTVGAGGALVPDYEGSNDYRLIPGAAVRGRINGISFSTRGAFLNVDLVARGKSKIDIDIGPIVGVRFSRSSKIRDAVVRLLPKRKKAIEIGGFVGASYHGLTNPYDVASFHVDVVKDIGNAHRSTMVSPSIDFGTPVSRHTYVGLGVGANWVGDGYADYYFSISPSDALTSGLSAYRTKGGLKDVRATMIVNQSLSGNLLHGWSLVGVAGYTRLLGDFKRSPIVSQRGSAGQWLGALGVAYTF